MNRERLAALLLALVTLLLYLPVQHNEFLFLDDPEYVVHNPVVQAGLTGPGIKWAFTTFHANNWHPLTWLSHMLDCQLFGTDAGAPHLINALLHSVNAALVLLLLLQLSGTFWPALFAAALFAWHPLRVESVAWVAERKDVLSSFFGLLALLLYVRYGRQQRKKCLWLALLFFGLGLMAKPMLVTLPFVFLLLDYWPLRRNQIVDPTSLVLEKWPFFLLSLASCVITSLAQSGQAIVPLEAFSLPLRLANAATACVIYLWKMVWPVDLAVFYPLGAHPNLPAVGAALFILAAIGGYAWRTRLTKPWLLLGWLWFLGTLVPVIGLVQVGNQALADRYTYLPMLGPIIALTYVIRDFVAHRQFGSRILAALGTLVLAACLLVTRRQLSYWHDNITLFSHAVAVTRDNVFANIILGTALDKHGQPAAAEAHYREALRIQPRNGLAHQNLAAVLDETGQLDLAMAEYRTALELQPNNPTVHYAYGTHLAQAGQYDNALQQYAFGAQLTPRDPQPYYLMGRARMKQGRAAEAVIHFHQALRLDPDHVPALVALARLLATDPNPEIRNADEAFVMANRANTLTGNQRPDILDTLAAAYAEGGHYTDATKALQQALLCTPETDTNNIVALQMRLNLYQNRQPYRESLSNIVLEPEKP